MPSREQHIRRVCHSVVLHRARSVTSSISHKDLDLHISISMVPGYNGEYNTLQKQAC